MMKLIRVSSFLHIITSLSCHDPIFGLELHAWCQDKTKNSLEVLLPFMVGEKMKLVAASQKFKGSSHGEDELIPMAVATGLRDGSARVHGSGGGFHHLYYFVKLKMGLHVEAEDSCSSLEKYHTLACALEMMIFYNIARVGE